MKHTSTKRIGLLTVLVLFWLALAQSASAQVSVTLAWDPSPDVVAGYNVYVGTASGVYGSPINNHLSTTITLTLNAGQTYYFVVTAYDAAGVESLPSNQATFVPPPPTTNAPPVAPTPLTIANTGQLLVSAAAVSNGTCVLQTSTNLTAWKSVTTGQTGQPLNYLTPLPGMPVWHYYRALWVSGPANNASIASALSVSNFSPEIVGFVTLNVAASGYTALANPFETGNNTLAALLPSMPEGAQLFKYSTGSGYTTNTFSGGVWADGTATLNPGEAGFLYNTSRTNALITFAGTILQSTVSNDIPAGYSLVSPMIPLPGAINTFPARNGDQIQFYENKTWSTYTFRGGRWSLSGPAYNPIVFTPGRAFFTSKKSPGVWTQSY
jgi:hypothetical protein